MKIARSGFSTYIHGGHLIDPQYGRNEPSDILVTDGKIAAIDAPGALAAKAREVKAESLDAGGAYVSPGFIDLNARMGEPGADSKEALSRGAESAAAGGFTSVLCAPSFSQYNDNAFITDFILRHAREESIVRVFPMGSLTQKAEGEQLAEIGCMVKAGVLAVGDASVCLQDSYLMRKALEYCKAFRVPIFSFPQDKSLVGRGVMDEGLNSCRLGLRGIPAAAEEVMVARDIVLTRHAWGKLHFSSISTKGSLDLIRDAKQEGLQITAETNPQYFSLTSDMIKTYDANYKCFPPLRGEDHVQAIINGLSDGTIDAIASMHTPQSPSSKDLVFEQASAGMIAFETVLPLALELVRKENISVERMVHLLSTGPAKILGLDQKGLGSLKIGAPADLVIFDAKKEFVYSESIVKSAAKNSPFLDKTLTGVVCYTMVGGEVVSRGILEDQT